MQRTRNHPGEDPYDSQIPQYSLTKTLLVWAAAAIPMGVLGWIVAPSVASTSGKPGFERLAVLALGLIWQCVLVLLLLYQEAGTLRWSAISQRLWLQAPRTPQTGEPRRWLWCWLIPLAVVTAIYQLRMMGVLQKVWVSLFPFLAEPAGFSFGSSLNDPVVRSQLVDNWGVLLLLVVSGLFNTVLGEELLFRGLLLPRMSGTFREWDWAANGVLFGSYHLHQPWGMLGSAIQGMFLFALPSRYFSSSWFGIVAHSGQTVYFTVLMLGLVLGLAR